MVSRFVILAFAMLLAIQAVWLVAAEMVRPNLPYFPVDSGTVGLAERRLTWAGRAARAGVFRGDLWSDYAVASASSLLRVAPDRPSAARQSVPDDIEANARWAARLSPFDARAWLVLARLRLAAGPPDGSAAEVLKMSYYVDPNRVELTPLRLALATRSDAMRDDELQILVSQEIRTIITRRPALKPAIQAAYGEASPAGKLFLASSVKPLDPNLLNGF